MGELTKAQIRELRQAKFDVRRLAERVEKQTQRTKLLEEAIREHHRQVVQQENWGADDELWDVLKLRGRPESYAAERRAA